MKKLLIGLPVFLTSLALHASTAFDCRTEPAVHFDSAVPALVETYNRNDDERIILLGQDSICGRRVDLARCHITSSSRGQEYNYEISCGGEILFTLSFDQAAHVASQACSQGKPYEKISTFHDCY